MITVKDLAKLGIKKGDTIKGVFNNAIVVIIDKPYVQYDNIIAKVRHKGYSQVKKGAITDFHLISSNDEPSVILLKKAPRKRRKSK